MSSRLNQLWVAGGLLVAAILLAVTWFLFVSPRNGAANSLRDQAALAESQLIPQEHRLAELRQQNVKLIAYQATLADNRKALPTSPAMPEFLRSLQAAGEATGVTVSDITVGSAEKAAGGTSVTPVPINLVATGTPDNLNRMLVQMQQVQPRALLVKSVDLQQEDGAIGGYSVHIDLDVFVSATG